VKWLCTDNVERDFFLHILGLSDDFLTKLGVARESVNDTTGVA